MKFKKFISKEASLIIAFFILTRIFLTLIGFYSNIHTPLGTYRWKQEVFSNTSWLNIWGVWDSSWYLNIAKHGYSVAPVETPKAACCGQNNFGFFPLYPLIIKIFQWFLKDYFIAGLAVSNLALLISAFFLYKLVSFNSKREEAFDSVKFLFAFPVSFILSGVLTESLFLMLLLISFYYAKKRKWLISGIAGYFLSLTRPNGLIVALPIIYEYLSSINFKVKRIGKESLSFLLFPLGTLTFGLISFALTRDFFTFIRIKNLAWGAGLANPVLVFWQSFFAGESISFLIGIPVLISAVFLVLNYKKLDFSYFFLAAIFILFILSNGLLVALGYLRTAATIFPFYIILGKIKNGTIKNILLVFSIALQGALMVMWCNGINIL